MVTKNVGYEGQKFIKIGKYLWVPIFSYGLHKSLVSMEGPCCVKCHTLYLEDSLTEVATCPECGDSIRLSLLDNTLTKLRLSATSRYSAALRSGWQVESLDLPSNAVKKDDRTDNQYFVTTKVGQKDGKKVAMILIGEKKDIQDKTDYAQIFLDLDHEMVSFDKSNKGPTKLLAKFTAEFPGSITEIKRQKSKDDTSNKKIK